MNRTELFATYAREAVRQYLLVHRKGESDSGFSGFRVSAERAAQSLSGTHSSVFDGDAGHARQTRVATLENWLDPAHSQMGPLRDLCELFGLTLTDVEILILTAAPALDARVRELYAFAWNDVRRECADAGFICDVLSAGDAERFEATMERFGWDRPLRRAGLLELEPRASREDSLTKNLTARRVRAADRILDYMRVGWEADSPIDESIASICSLGQTGNETVSLSLPKEAREELHRSTGTAPRVVLSGPRGAGKRRAVQELAETRGLSVLVANLSSLLLEPPDVLEKLLRALLRESKLRRAWLYMRAHDLPDTIHEKHRIAIERFVETPGIFLGAERLPGWAVGLTTGWPEIPVPLPDVHYRTEYWKKELEESALGFEPDMLRGIATRYAMSNYQIQQAASEARRLARANGHARLEILDVNRACQSYFAHKLSDLADPVPPASFRPEDLILEGPEREKFDEIMLVAKEQEAVYDEWGFGEKFPYGRGLSVLFYGPPGTGKTMASSIIANMLGLDLYRIDLSRIVSRYVGETEKNLARVFDEAERGRVMLLFDEADSLFTKRTEVKNSVDRYANLEVAYLLQRMENFEGITVLTTNVVDNLDDAFTRRIRYRIGFPMPGPETRTLLWRTFLPKKAPVRPDLPFELLGEEFPLAGAYIKKAVLRAAFYARRDQSDIGLKHLVSAARSESEELGTLVYDRISGPLEDALAEEDEVGIP